MRAPNHRAVKSLLTLAALTAALHAQGTPIGFEETWALAQDRAKVVNTLIPGTDDFYYYHCRERLDARDFATVRKVLPTWIERHGENQRVVEVQNRLALLAIEDDPQATFTLLRRRLGVTFDHQPVVPGAKSDLPTALDAARLSAETRTTQLLTASPDDVDGFTDVALPALAARSLTPGQLHSLLRRLTCPDLPNLPALVVRNLEDARRGSFGKLRIHQELRTHQLEECARLRPALLQEPAFVNAWLTRLQPNADSDWRADPTAREAQLQRLWDFAQRLSPSFNSLKAHVLHHWLRLDLERGAPDKQRFLAYLQLPRRGNHAPREVPRALRADNYVDPMAQFATGLPQVGDDEAVLRPCLEHFFATEDDHTPYAAWLDAGWLKVVLAETKLLLGQGDQARWYTLLDDASAGKQLEQRVEITFARSQRTRFAAGDAVSLLVDVKNVPSLQIKIYEVDSYRYLIERQRPVDASIELDGVVANHEQTRTFTAPPLRRVRTTIDLPELRQPGTYVVELVGNGISSRAVIRKGDLRLGARTTAAGQAISVFDETGVWCRDAKVWFGGREYGADEQGEILLPFSTAAGNHLLVLQQGPRAALARFPHLAESYTLTTRVAVAREALIAGQDATIVLRPQLRLADRELALQLLQDPVLTIVATDLDGRTMPQEVRNPTLRDDGEFVHTLRVPERLQSLTVSLAGRVKTLAGEDQQLTAGTTTMVVNGMDLTAATAGLELVRTRDGYALEVRGKNGEPRGGRSLALTLHHREFVTPFEVVLQTAADGRARLGDLVGITGISAASVDTTQNFDLTSWRGPLPELLQGLAGETLRLPCPVATTTPSRRDFALLAVDRDCFEHLAIADGRLELRGLPAGDYELRLHGSGRSIPVRVTAGTRNGGWLIGAERILQSSPTTPLTLRGIDRTDSELVVRLGNADHEARVHVLATRFLPQQSLLAQLTPWQQEEPAAFTAATLPSLFHSGRKLGDEYRYVLDRRNEARLPGNMLARPSLLVNPWRLDQQSFNAAVDRDGKKGTGYDAMPPQPGGASGPATAGPAGPRPTATPAPAIAPNVPFANLDYLPQGAVLRTNLRPDADGVVRIPLADLGHGQLVQVVAMLGDQMVGDVVVRDELPLTPRPRHLREAIAPTRHVIEQKRMEFVAAGGTTTLDDPRAAQVEVFDSLASVFRVFLATRGSDDLARFAFVCKWPELDAKQQRELYDQHACHELNFFLYQKDRAFFDAVIRPLLACKL
ncbi:MAG: hypothetical protein IT455_15345, partial [Planctomycetes bacterium]|nr:hypothetical protein [Planctomycetota bacterium]